MIQVFRRKTVVAGCLVLLAIGLAASKFAQAADGERQRTLWRGMVVEYFEQDGLAIAEGDIVLGTAEEMRRAQQHVPKIAQDTKPEALVDTGAPLWLAVGSGVIEVPYVYEAGSQTEVDAAIASFNSTFTGFIQWVPRVAQTDYVAFNMVSANQGSCASSIGRIGGRQQITGDPTCNANLLLHEMGHAIGLWHVQNDPAAASFVDVRLDRISPRSRFNSEPRPLTRSYSGYDYRSIMHYGRTSFYMSADLLTMDTRPAGIDIGIREGYSAADLDAIRRIYGSIATATTVTTNPPGLRVRVDGQEVVTPAVFNWPIGSQHQLDVPAGLQTLGGFSFGFGRWSHDASVAPLSAGTWTVVAGKGYPGQPTSAPETTVLIANFVRLLAITSSATGSTVNGTFSVTPENAPWPGTTNLYPNYTKFTFAAQPIADRYAVWTWSRGFGMTGGFGASPSGTLRVSDGTASQSVGVSFAGPTGLLLTVSGPGVDASVPAKVTRPDGTEVSVLMPYAYTNGGPGVHKINVPATQTRGTDVRFVLDGIDGLDDAANSSVTVVASRFAPVTVRVHKELQSVVQRNPTCGGSLTLSDAGPWHAHGLNLTATAAPNAGVTFAGWTGSVSGLSTVLNTVVGDAVPELVANFNLIAEPLAINSITPSSLLGNGPWTIEIRGTGFTAATRVAVNGSGMVPVLVDSRLLRVEVTGANLSTTGKTPIYLYTSLGGSCNVFSKTSALDALPASAATGAIDYSDMWWAGQSENGWGMSITQHGNVQFVVLYVYDNSGKPVWYVMPGGSWNAGQTAYTGSLYLPTSSPFSAYDATKFKANASVGTATLTYASSSTATLNYTINGVSGTKSLSRQIFGSGQAPMQVHDLWWNPTEDGWGLNIAQQGQILFPVWYTYDAAGKDTWYVVPGGTWTGNSFTGDMYSTTGSAWLGATYNPTALVVTKVGSMTLNFSTPNAATMTYTVNGLTQSKSIVRQPY